MQGLTDRLKPSQLDQQSQILCAALSVNTTTMYNHNRYGTGTRLTFCVAALPPCPACSLPAGSPANTGSPATGLARCAALFNVALDTDGDDKVRHACLFV